MIGLKSNNKIKKHIKNYSSFESVTTPSFSLFTLIFVFKTESSNMDVIISSGKGLEDSGFCGGVDDEGGFCDDDDARFDKSESNNDKSKSVSCFFFDLLDFGQFSLKKTKDIKMSYTNIPATNAIAGSAQL